jgi:hypothetical protein
MKVCLLQAALGSLDTIVAPVEQALLPGDTLDVRTFTDATFPPRTQTMTPRLQSRIVKMFGYEMVPGYDAYLWVDASFSLQSPDSAAWMLAHLQNADFCTFAHPERSSCRGEAQFISEKIALDNRYLSDRYRGELIDEQLNAIRQPGFEDDHLYATMVIGYRPTPSVRAMLREWWVHTSRYHAVDQLALPFVLWQWASSVRLSVLEGDPFHSPYLTRVRRRGL